MATSIIGITDCSKYENYVAWFSTEDVQIIKLSPKENNIQDLEKCDGLVLTGGGDIHPKYFGHPDWMNKKEELKLDVDEERDAFEMIIIDNAVKNNMPILGICRGMQITNVYFKGTLIPDINEASANLHSKKSGVDINHAINIEVNSVLSKIVGCNAGIVNSAHHQAIHQVGEGLKHSAITVDGIVEALEWKTPDKKPFLMLIQWHPERMEDQESSFSNKIKKEFLAQLIKK